jgi:hypothetical protein
MLTPSRICILYMTIVAAGLLGPGIRFSGTAYAGAVLVSNLGQLPADPSPTFISASVWNAAVFVTGDAPALFESATLEVDGGRPGNFWTTLYADNNGVPGQALPGGLLTGPSQPAGGRTTYSAVSPIALDAHTRYWLVAASDASGSSGQSYGLYMTFSGTYTSDFGWQLPKYLAFTNDAGATWVSTIDATIPRPFYLEVSGTVVPEPSGVLALSSGAFVALRRNRRRRCR